MKKKRTKGNKNAKVNFEWAEPVYTGGGIYIFLGKIEGGDWFYACDSWYDVRLLDAAPNEKDDDYEFCGDNPSWQDAHMVRDMEDKKELLRFWRSLYNWIIERKPEGNYATGDMVRSLESLETCINKL